MKRLVYMCHLIPSVSPHGAEVPTSVWNLPFGMWLGLAGFVDDYLAQKAKEAKQQ
jgi:hypothetical protein